VSKHASHHTAVLVFDFLLRSCAEVGVPQKRASGALTRVERLRRLESVAWSAAAVVFAFAFSAPASIAQHCDDDGSEDENEDDRYGYDERG